MLKVVNTENQLAREFRLTIGLQEGYSGEGVLHTPEEVGHIVAEWMHHQRETRGIYLPGSITPSTITYWGRSAQKMLREPIVFYEGLVSPEYNAEVSDEDVLKTLHQLAEVLSRQLKQGRIYLHYRERVIILEQQ
jgi:hypothetical protein